MAKLKGLVEPQVAVQCVEFMHLKYVLLTNAKFKCFEVDIFCPANCNKMSLSADHRPSKSSQLRACINLGILGNFMQHRSAPFKSNDTYE